MLHEETLRRLIYLLVLWARGHSKKVKVNFFYIIFNVLFARIFWMKFSLFPNNDEECDKRYWTVKDEGLSQSETVMGKIVNFSFGKPKFRSRFFTRYFRFNGLWGDFHPIYSHTRISLCEYRFWLKLNFFGRENNKSLKFKMWFILQLIKGIN